MYTSGIVFLLYIHRNLIKEPCQQRRLTAQHKLGRVYLQVLEERQSGESSVTDRRMKKAHRPGTIIY
jgi:hypothetical protein